MNQKIMSTKVVENIGPNFQPKGIDPDYKLIGKRARKARKEAKISRNEIASILGVSQQQVYKLETGDNRISSLALYKMSKTYLKPVDWFFEGVEQDSPASQNTNHSLPSLIQRWRYLRNDAWKDIRDTSILLEEHHTIEKKIADYPIHTHHDAHTKLQFLYSLWWQSTAHPPQERDYVAFATFKSVLEFLSDKNQTRP